MAINKTKIIEDQIRYQETLISNLRCQIKQCRSPEGSTHLQAQLAHALAGLAALCRDGESTKGAAVEVTEKATEYNDEYPVYAAEPLAEGRWCVTRNGEALTGYYDTQAEAEYAVDAQLKYQQAMAERKSKTTKE
jgi:hypothetical protein